MGPKLDPESNYVTFETGLLEALRGIRARLDCPDALGIPKSLAAIVAEAAQATRLLHRIAKALESGNSPQTAPRCPDCDHSERWHSERWPVGWTAVRYTCPRDAMPPGCNCRCPWHEEKS